MNESKEQSYDPHFFRFDLDTAIRDQLLAHLSDSPLLTLEKGVGPTESGIYGLYYNGDLVYVGKASKETTKSGRTLRQRLNEHINKINRHQNIAVEEVSVRFVTFESEWWVFAAEYVLIAYFAPPWNYSGFGSKTPGRGRPGTERVSTWSEMFPPKDTT